MPRFESVFDADDCNLRLVEFVLACANFPLIRGVVEIPEAPEARHEQRSEGIEATEFFGEGLECSNS